MSYYQRHREEIIANQIAYHIEHREARLAYMREYNKKYYASHKPKPKPKKVKPPKEKKLKTPKPTKEPKPKPKIVKLIKVQEPVIPSYPTTFQRGSFVLSFD